MARGSAKMMDWIRELCYEGKSDQQMVEKTLHREKVLDNIEREIVAFLTDVLDGTVPHSVAEEGREQLRLAHEFESVGDYLASILKEFTRLREQKLELANGQLQDLSDLHDQVRQYLRRTIDAYEQRRPRSDADAKADSDAIVERIRALRDAHLQLITETQFNPGLTLAYTTILTHYRRVRAHVLNAHQAMAGTKAQPRS